MPFELSNEILTSAEGDHKKSSKLVHALLQLFKSKSDPDQYLVNICNVLINQQQQTLTDIAISILQQLGQFVILLLIIINIFHISGQPIPDRPTHSSTPDRPTHSGTPDRPTHSSTPDRPTHSSTPDRPTCSSTPDRPTHSGTPDRPTHSSTPDRPTHSSTPDGPTHSSTLDPSLQEYCQIIKDKFKIYKNESEWPVLRCGEQYFGRLSLVDRNAQNNKQWSITRGDNDIISQEHSKIKIEDVLKPNDSDQSLTVVVDGPPGIGKTTLCRKLLNFVG